MRCLRLGVGLGLLGVLLSASSAQAYYDDIHYAFTYYIARHVGYTAEQAYRIASLALAVDYDPETEPVQGPAPTSGNQNPRWMFHAFRNELEFDDVVGDGAEGSMAETFVTIQRDELWKQALGWEVPNPGVYLHFLQDIGPHQGYGSRWGHWPAADRDQFELHLARGLSVGGTTDWASAKDVPEGSLMDFAEETHRRLELFLEAIAPQQPRRPFNAREYIPVVRQLLYVNQAPVPIDSERKRIMWARLYADKLHLFRGRSRAPEIATLAAELDGGPSWGFDKHLVGPDLEVAVVAVNEILGSEGYKGSLSGTHYEYELDSDGELDNEYMRNLWTLTGDLTIELYDEVGTKAAAPEQGLVTVRVLTMEDGPGEIVGTPRPVTFARSGQPGPQRVRIGPCPNAARGWRASASAVQSCDEFKQLPIGDLVIEVTGSGGKLLARKETTLHELTDTVRVDTQRTAARVLRGHTADVWTVGVSPDNAVIASGGSGGELILWDLRTGTLMWNLSGHRDTVLSLAFAPTGRLLASCDAAGAVILWDWDAIPARQLRTLAQPTPGTGCGAVAVSPDGRTVAARGAGIRLWDAATGALRTTLRGGGSGAPMGENIAFSPDGTMLAAPSSNAVILWDLATGTRKHTLLGHGGQVSKVSFSPDGTRLASGTSTITTFTNGVGRLGGEVIIWDTRTGELLGGLPRHSHGIFALSFSPDGKALATRDAGIGLSDQILLWDVADWRLYKRHEGHTDPLKAIAFAPDGRAIVTGGWDDTVRVWPYDPPPTRPAPGTTTTRSRPQPATPAFDPSLSPVPLPGSTEVGPGRAADPLVGMGMELIELNGRIQVGSVVDGQPAAAMGFAVGDRLQAVNGTPVAQLTLAQIQELLSRSNSTPVRLEFLQLATNRRTNLTVGGSSR